MGKAQRKLIVAAFILLLTTTPPNIGEVDSLMKYPFGLSR
jgi:hypothetical protein